MEHTTQVVPSYVGIDVAKDRLDVHVLPSRQSFAVARDGEGLDQLVDALRRLAPTLIVLEATGGFELIVAAALAGAGLPLIVAAALAGAGLPLIVAAALAGAGLPLAVVNPRQIRAFARAIGRLAKTDALNAEVIALFAERIRPEPRPLPDADSRDLADLVGRRRQVVEMIGMESNRRSRPAILVSSTR